MQHWIEKMEISSKKDAVMDNYLELHQSIANGEFWYDKIKKLRADSTKKLELALANLPLPAAFQEAAIALRALIKEAKSKIEDYTSHLRNLYELACVFSFMLNYAPKLEQPGFNMMLEIAGGLLFRLKMDYSEIGVEQLTLLNKTDKKLLVEIYGEPHKHTTMNEVYKEIWDQKELEMLVKEKRTRQKL